METIALPLAGGVLCFASYWLGFYMRGREERKRAKSVRRTDLTQTRIEPDRNGQAGTPQAEGSHRRRQFSKSRRPGTPAHVSQFRPEWTEDE